MDDVRKEMNRNKASVLVVTALDEVACKLPLSLILTDLLLGHVPGLFNIRGADIDYNPVVMSYAIVTTHDIRLVHFVRYLFNCGEPH